MRIRLLQEKDIPMVVSIVGLNYSKKYQKLVIPELYAMFSHNSIRPMYYVVEENKEIIGFGGYTQSWMDYTIYEMLWINVHPIRQKQGMGQRLILKLLAKIRKKKNAQLIVLTTSSPQYYKKKFNFTIMEKLNDGHYLMKFSIEN